MDCDLPERIRRRADKGWRAYKRGYATKHGKRILLRTCPCALASNGEWLPDPLCRTCRGYGVILLE
jgi:hypothetical protein